MITLLQRFRPSRTTLAALGGLVWALSLGAVRDFVWVDLREGMMSTRGLSRAMRVLVWSGFALLGAMIFALLFNDLWRALSPLIALEHVSGSTAGRGALLPMALIPVTLFLIALSWSLMLAGALHSHPALRVAALLLYVPFALLWVGAGASDLAGGAGSTLAALLAVLGVPALFAARWRAPERPELEFALLLALVTAACAIGQARALALWRSTEMPLALAVVELSVAQLKGLVMPMLFLLGLDIAGFTRQGAGWAARFVAERLPRWGLWTALLGGLALRLHDVALEAGELLTRPEDLGMYAGALLGLAVIVGAWAGLERFAAQGGGKPGADAVAQAAERWAMPLILAFHLVALATPLPAQVLIVASVLSGRSELTGFGAQVVALLNPASLVGAWHTGLYLFALGASLWLARRGRTAAALYLGAFGSYNLWLKLSEPGGPLGMLAQRGSAPEDFWLVLALAACALTLAARRVLTAAWAGRLLTLLLITGLLRQTDFIENPFSPFLGFAGIGFIAFGLVWDALTRGAWANRSTPGLPRTGRVMMYLGYVLLTVTLVNWSLTSHSLLDVGQFTGDAALNGLDRFGRPLLYVIFCLTLASRGDEE